MATAWSQQALTNGGQHTGELSPAGDADNWTFTAPAGASVMLRVGGTNVTPRIRLFGPSNEPIGEQTSGNTFVRDGTLSVTTTNAGAYTVVVSATSPSQTGSYGLHLAMAPGAFSVPAGDEGGVLTSGAANEAALSLGDLDLWSFDASAGDHVMIRMGSATVTPWLRLYGPTGALVDETTSGNSFTRDGFLTLQTTNAGTYTLVASAVYAGQIGDYSLHLAQAPGAIAVSPGDQGGPLTNGAFHNGTLAVGDLDVWGFTAQAGDALVVRMGATNVTPWLRLYDPAGALIAQTNSGNTFTRDGVLTLQTTNTGAHTLVVSATFAGQSGDYGLHFAHAPGTIAVSPGDEGGPLTNGAFHNGTLAVGDLDVWGFTAQAGDALMIRMGGTNVTPWLRLYDPSGALVDETTSGNSFARDGFLTLQATNSGAYTLVACATFAGQNGDYGLHFAQAPGAIAVSPGDEGGDLVSGTSHTGNLALGDLDVWQFSAEAGNGLMIRMGGTNLTPWLRLYDPAGSLIAQTNSGNSFARDGVLTLQATNAGVHTLVVSATHAGQFGGYGLRLTRAPGDSVITPGDEGGMLVNGQTNVATLDLGDLDVWTFLGTPGDSNVLRVVSTVSSSFTPWIRLYGPDGALAAETTSGNSFTRAGSVNLTLTNAGLYTVVISAAYPGQSGPYTFKQSRVPPDLIVPETQHLDESGVLQVSVSAQDPDEPTKPLGFTLLSAPPGLTLALAGATNATLSWTTSEADGPSTNVIVASVTDFVNGTPFIRTNSFTVVVNEVNTAPALVVPGSQTVDEGTLLEVTATATDVDLPANELRFALVGPPEGMTIDPVTGAIRWTPTEAQGPASYPITVVVTDDNPWAVNDTAISVTNQFTVVVREVNLPPSLAVPPATTLDELTTLAVSASAADADLPANPLAFRLLTQPVGMTIDPLTGALAWTPTEAQGPSTNLVTVVVTDNSPSAANTTQWSVTNAFTVIVREINLPPTVVLPADKTTVELDASTASVTASDTDLPATPLAFQLLSPPAGMSIDAATGAITWTPTEEHGPSTNRITVVVSETTSASPDVSRISVTNSFQWIVTELNTAPVLQAIADESVHYGVPLSIQAQGSDTDLPANTLLFSLEQAPEGMTIDSATGLMAWTPAESQVGVHPVTVRLSDTATPPLTVTQTFSVTVSGVGARLSITQIAGGLIQITSTGDVGVTYELQGSVDLIEWTRITEFQSTATPHLYIDPLSLTAPSRSYRLQLRQ